jgi:hypothetical protein
LDSVEVYQPTNTDKSQPMSRENYVYNFEVENTHTYIANNCVVHNCHHYDTNTYSATINYFNPKALIGFTATPYSSDNGDITNLFSDGEVFHLGMDWMIEHGYLTPFQEKEVPVLDFSPESIFLSWCEHADEKKTIIFCATTQEADDVVNFFRQGDIPIAACHAGIPRAERQQTLQDYADDKLLLLVNCQTLTEGFDEPSIECVILAKNVNFEGLKRQMIGRGLRLHEGKESLIVLKLKKVDNIFNLHKHEITTEIIEHPAPSDISEDVPVILYPTIIEDNESKYVDYTWSHSSLPSEANEPLWERVILSLAGYLGYGCGTLKRYLPELGIMLILAFIIWLGYHIFHFIF